MTEGREGGIKELSAGHMKTRNSLISKQERVKWPLKKGGKKRVGVEAVGSNKPCVRESPKPPSHSRGKRQIEKNKDCRWHEF